MTSYILGSGQILANPKTGGGILTKHNGFVATSEDDSCQYKLLSDLCWIADVQSSLKPSSCSSEADLQTALPGDPVLWNDQLIGGMECNESPPQETAAQPLDI
ncbi:hypothetical protein AOLI_G00045060 [Acnodon oligacanthus]